MKKLPSLLVLSVTMGAAAEEPLFDPSLIGGGYDPQVIARLQAGGQPPGSYDVEIVINGKSSTAKKLNFVSTPDLKDGVGLVPCMMENEYLELGFAPDEVAAVIGEKKHRGDEAQCISMTSFPFVIYRFRFAKKQVELTVPDNKLVKQVSDYIPPSLFDDGVPALMTSYRVTDFRSLNGDIARQQYLSMMPGANLGPWRVRSQLAKSGQESSWHSSYFYLQRDISSIKSTLTAGQQALRSMSFDAPYFKGVQLGTAEEMLTRRESSYTPIVRGVAKSAALVTILQDGRQIYQGTVAAGPFEIGDLSIYGSGELVVSVVEANGEESRFILPFSTGFSLIGEGAFKYNVATGEIDLDQGTSTDRRFVALEAQYGLPFSATLAAGIQKTEDYTAISGGLGMDMGSWGSSFFDSVYTRQSYSGQQGQMVRARYAKLFDQVGFNVNAGLSKYLDHYTTLSQTLTMNSPTSQWPQSNNDDSFRRYSNTAEQYMGSQLDIGVSQSLPAGFGSVGGTFSATSGRVHDKRSYALNYFTVISDYNLSLNLSRTENAITGQPDTALSLGINYIFGGNAGSSRLLRYEYANQTSLPATHRLSLNGNSFDDNSLSWGGRAEFDASGEVTRSGVDTVYRHNLARLNASLSHTKGGDTSLNSGIEGAIVAHMGGVTFTDRLSETNILVNTGDVVGVKSSSDLVKQTDGGGFMLLPANPYKYNNVNLNGETIPDSARLLTVKKTLVPTKGAIAMADFPSVTGSKMLITLMDMQGGKLGAGSRVILSGVQGEDEPTTTIDDFGRAYFEGVKQGRGVLRVVNGDNTVCKSQYDTTMSKTHSGIYIITLTCS